MLEICLNALSTIFFTYKHTFCAVRIVGLDCGVAVANWLSEVIGEAASLVRKLPSSTRSFKRKLSANGEIPNDHRLALTNEAQFLLLSRSSLRHVLSAMVRNDVAESCDKNVDVDTIAARFRSNFIVSGSEAFDEESWKAVSFTGVGRSEKFLCVGLCNRCSMVCIDHSTGQRGIEPLRTLGTLPPSKYVRSEVQKIPSKRRNHFGVYLHSTSHNFTIKVGCKINPEK